MLRGAGTGNKEFRELMEEISALIFCEAARDAPLVDAEVKAGHIGMYRDPLTLQPVEYYRKLPADCAERVTFLADPMLAAGGMGSAATKFLKATS